jgi:hypothetical protein
LIKEQNIAKNAVSILRRHLTDNLHQSSVAVSKDWWVERGVDCIPFKHGKRLDTFTCFPHGRIILNVLMDEHNFSASFPPPSEVSSGLMYSPPYFGEQCASIIIPGPFGRADPWNHSVSVFYNTSTGKFENCFSISENLLSKFNFDNIGCLISNLYNDIGKFNFKKAFLREHIGRFCC